MALDPTMSMVLARDIDEIDPYKVTRAASLQQTRLSLEAVDEVFAEQRTILLADALAGGPDASESMKLEAVEMLHSLHYWTGFFLEIKPKPCDAFATRINTLMLAGIREWSCATWKLVLQYALLHPERNMRHISWAEFHSKEWPVGRFKLESWLGKRKGSKARVVVSCGLADKI